jgi:hypothetical protein
MSVAQRLSLGLKTKFPRAFRTARTTKQLLKLIPRVYGYEDRKCTICGYAGKFHAEIHFPDIFTYDAVCPDCGSLPRNRLLRLAIDEKQLLKDRPRVLHFAPEGPVTGFVKPGAGLYSTADIDGRFVDFELDIQNIDQPDASWDLIICSHVLEHVDHRLALAELRRILTPGGKLLALFPVVDGWPSNYENPQAVSPRERGLHFGKDNHVRRFGAGVARDFADAGLELERYAPIGPEVVTYGLIPGETLFIGTRRA